MGNLLYLRRRYKISYMLEQGSSMVQDIVTVLLQEDTQWRWVQRGRDIYLLYFFRAMFLQDLDDRAQVVVDVERLRSRPRSRRKPLVLQVGWTCYSRWAEQKTEDTVAVGCGLFTGLVFHDARVHSARWDSFAIGTHVATIHFTMLLSRLYVAYLCSSLCTQELLEDANTD